MNLDDLPPTVVGYVRYLDAAVAEQLGSALIGTYLHGSVALGGFSASRSDIDLLMVVSTDTGVADHAWRCIAASVRHAPCPARGVEVSFVDAGDARAPAEPWPFLLHIATGPNDPKAVSGRGHDGDRDLLMHYAVTRVAGIAIRGPDPQDAIGTVDRSAILAYLTDELSWATANASEAYVVLNAGRALRYLHDGQFVSKIDGAEEAIAVGAPLDLVARALASQRGARADRRPSPPAVAFACDVSSKLQRQAG